MLTPEEIRASMRLYAVTDQNWLRGRSLVDCVAQAIEGGLSCVQLREKQPDPSRTRALACDLQELCAAAHIPFLINDDVDLARAIGADGVHIGQDDMACEQARARLGAEAIIGVSVQNRVQAIKAQTEGADYLGVGAMFGTPTKPDASEVSLDELREICNCVTIPVVAIGGLNLDTIGQLKGTGVDGVAVVSAIFAASDIKEATAQLLKLARSI